MKNAVVVAGATGNLGGRIVTALLEKGAEVHALVRPSSERAKLDALEQKGVHLIHSEMTDAQELATAFNGVACVVSALQGLRDVIVDTQSVLLDAAVAAGVPRFISSDFASDFTQLPDGANRNFDLRREFMRYADQADTIQVTSVLNGAFADILGYGTPLLNPKQKTIGYWEDSNWKIDFTTMDNTAAFTAAAALDESAPRLLRIASFQVSPNDLVAMMSDLTGEPFTAVNMGTRAEFAAYIQRNRAAHPEGEEELYASWQQSQYLHSMFSVQNNPLDNDRYPGIAWTPARDILAAQQPAQQPAEH